MNRVNSLTLGLIMLGTSVLSAQSPSGSDTIKSRESKIKSWTIGIGGVYLYDLLADRFDTPLEPDLQGLNGDNTQLDIGIDAYIEKQFTPLFGMKLGFRGGSMTGSNGNEYYENTFNELTLRGQLVWSNLARNRSGARWNYYTTLGTAYGRFDAQRFLENGNVENREGVDGERYWSSYLGAGAQYMLNHSWRIELEMAYNTVFDDGFDGFNAFTGSDAFLSTALSLAYTLGNKDKPAMHATNYFAQPYMENREARAAERLAEQMQMQDSTLTNSLADTKDSLNALRKNFQSGQMNDAERLRKLEESKGSSVTIANKVHVFFAIESATLTAQSMKALMTGFYQKNQPITIIGYADKTGPADYNARLKQERAESVRDFLIDVMGYDPTMISLKTGKSKDAGAHRFLNRRVEVMME